MKQKIAMFLLVVLLLAVIPTIGFARDWWIMEAVYTLQDREPVKTTGPESRIFLPNLTAKTVDGLPMDMKWEVSKDGKKLDGGEYAPGLWFDLTGAGTYLFTFTGVDASNSWMFRVVADENLPSFIPEGTVCTAVFLSENLVLPAARIIYRGETVEASIRLCMESGAIYEYDEKAVPEAGLMTAEYEAEIAGEQIRYTYLITVNDDTIGFYDESGNFYPAGTKPFDEWEMSGAVLDSVVSKTYTYSKILDLSAMEKDLPLIVLGNAGVNVERVQPKIRIVDAHNARNYIEIQGRWSADNADMVYSVAGIGGQNMVGHMSGSTLYSGTVFGTETVFATSSSVGRDKHAIYYYDAAEKAVYSDWYGSKFLIADFDAGYNAKAWEGFTNGEVYLQVIRTNDSDFICVESVAGADLGAVGQDTVAPTIRVEEGSGAYALAGRAYPLMKATATDVLEGSLPVQLHVYRGCDATSGVEMEVTDGCFTPIDTGYYTAVYTAVDSYGNIAMRKFNIEVRDESTVAPIQADVTGLPEAALVGEKLTLPIPTNVSGGSGGITWKINLISASGQVSELTQDHVIMPEAGINTIEYILMDYLGMSQSICKEILCEESDVPVLYDVQLPQILFTGTRLQLPVAKYYERAGEAVEIAISATLDGVPQEIVDGCIVPETKNSRSELKIVYTARNDAGSSTKEYVISLLGADPADRTTYFYTINGTFNVEQKQNSIAFTTAQSGSSFQFANSVLADKLELVFGVDPERNDCDRITIWLTDALDTSVRIRLDIVKKADGDANSTSKFYINGVRANDMAGNFYSSATALGISYQKNSVSLVDAQRNALGKLTTTADGRYFDGFPSGEVNVEICCGTVGEGTFSFDVQKINNQVFAGGDSFFNNYPEIVINGTLPLEVSVGDKLTVPSAIGADVLSPNVTISLTIKKGSQVILENAAVDQTHDFTFDSYGTYYVIYQYSDGITERSASYTIKTIENEPPTVEMPSLPTTGKVGQKIELAMPTVSDGQSTQIRVSIIVCEPNYNMFKVNEDEMAFTPKRAGTYTVFYYVSDECNNYQKIEHKIVVE